MVSVNVKQGQNIEQQVCQFLEKQGLHKVQQNYQCRLGEIDLIMQEETTLVFVEVRYRKSGLGADSVDNFKQKRLHKTAQYYLQCRHLVDKCPCRFDVVAVTHQQQQLVIDWIQNAF